MEEKKKKRKKRRDDIVIVRFERNLFIHFLFSLHLFFFIYICRILILVLIHLGIEKRRTNAQTNSLKRKTLNNAPKIKAKFVEQTKKKNRIEW